MTHSEDRQAGPSASAAILGALGIAAMVIFLPDTVVGLEPLDRWALSVVALGLLVVGLCARRGAMRFGMLGFAFLTGGAAQLYLTEPLWFPTMRLKPQDMRDVMAFWVILFEAGIAALAWRRMDARGLIAEGLRRFGRGRLAVFVLLSALFVSPLLNYIWRGAAVAYLAHVVIGTALICLHLAVLVAMARAKCPVSGLHRLSPVAPAAATFVAALLLGGFGFQHLPHVEDEVAYLFQAQLFAEGALSAPAPPAAAQHALDYYLLEVKDGRWYSTSVPGWPLVLMPFLKIGLPWLLNPLLAALSVFLAHDITRMRVGRDQADLVALMMATSPWLLAAAGSLMPHTLTLALMLLAWWLVLRAPPGSAKAGRRLFMAGLALGWIFTTRPLDGLIIGGLTGLWVLAGPGGSLRRAVIFSAGCVLTGAVLLWHNMVMTGSPFRLALSDYLDRAWGKGANAFGFGDQIGPPGGWGILDLWPGHGPLEAVLNTVNLGVSLQLDFLGWSIGSLALIFAFFLWQGTRRAFDLVMIAVIVVIVAVIAFYWFADSYYFGPRYWFLAAFPLFYLAARGYDALRSRLSAGDGAAAIRLDTVLGFCCLFGLLVFTPWRGVGKFYEYGNFHDRYRQALDSDILGNALVLFRKSGELGSAFVLNDPWLSASEPIFLFNDGTLNEDALRAAFPGREILHFDAGWTSRHAPPG